MRRRRSAEPLTFTAQRMEQSVFDCAVTSSVVEFGDHANSLTLPIAVPVTAFTRCVATLTTKSRPGLEPVVLTTATLRESGDHVGGVDRLMALRWSRSTFDPPLAEISRRLEPSM